MDPLVGVRTPTLNSTTLCQGNSFPWLRPAIVVVVHSRDDLIELLVGVQTPTFDNANLP